MLAGQRVARVGAAVTAGNREEGALGTRYLDDRVGDRVAGEQLMTRRPASAPA